jgi:hypothetical protein
MFKLPTSASNGASSNAGGERRGNLVGVSQKPRPHLFYAGQGYFLVSKSVQQGCAKSTF